MDLHRKISHILLYIFVLLGLKYSHGVKILGIASKHRVSDDFIVVMNLNQTNCEANIEKFIWQMTNISRDALHTDTYTMGSFVALRIRIADTWIEKVGSHPDVKYIEVNQRIAIAQNPLVAPSPNPLGECKLQSTGSSLWGLTRIASHTKPTYVASKYSYLASDGDGVDVYVMDTGVYEGHSEFQGRAKNAYVVSSMRGEGLSDLQGHGTHVSGIIAGKTYGVAKNATILAIKVLNKDGIGTTADLIEGLEWVYNDYIAKKNAKGQRVKGVVNLSLGGSPMETESLDEAAITMITEAGMPFVIASGNDNFDACDVSPGRLSVAITVGATDSSDIMPSYSNFGPCVDILAPGDAVMSSYIGSPTAKGVLSGTSMAAPYVTGVIARFLSQVWMSPSPASLKAWLIDTSTKSMVNVGAHQSTPNRLLYMGCIALGKESFKDSNWFFGPVPDSTAQQALQDQRFFVVFIALCVLLAFCLVSVILLGVALKHISTLRKTMRDSHARETQNHRDRTHYQPVYGYQNPDYHYPPYPTAPGTTSETSRLLS